MVEDSQLLLDLGTSPDTVVKSILMVENSMKRTPPALTPPPSPATLSLDEFVQELPQVIAQCKERGLPAGSKEDPIMELFERLDLQLDDYQVFRHFDAHRNYTRNLVATDHQTYTLLLLCWNPGRESPIHDHPCDGCWMRVLEGAIQECRYHPPSDNSKLECYEDETYQNGIVFIKDSLGLHKVGNPSTRTPAVTLHLYAPPFGQCRIWLDGSKRPSASCICHYSEYGKLV